MRLLALSALLTVGCTTPTAGPVAPRSVQQLQGKAFGTTFSIKWLGSSPSSQEVEGPVIAALERVDARMSTWRPDSELQDVRRGDGSVVVSDETLEVVRAGLALAETTGGAFDPTVEPLMELWGFRGKARDEPPTPEEIEAARAQVGFRKVSLGRTNDGEAFIDAGGTALDLSAIAKGHGVDALSSVLSRLGATDHFVEIGGEVRAHGSGPNGAWRVGVDRPEAGVRPGTRFAAQLALTNASLATSGNYRNAYQAGEVRVVHTMDPRTGRPHDSVVASVSVIAPDCRTADGWATSLMVLGLDDGRALIEAQPFVDALWLVTTSEGFEQQRSSGMADWIVAANEPTQR
ncbi:MAG: FAD:protein FMN transferase [Myxococcota bacterium]